MTNQKIVERIIQRKIVILGLGKNNFGLLKWLLSHGAKDITICDQNQDVKEAVQKSSFGKLTARVKFQIGPDHMRHLDQFEILFRTPGIAYLSVPIQKAREAGVRIFSQTRLFFDLCPAKTVGITGTKGKGTTAALLFDIITQKKLPKSKVYLAGNIGIDPFEFIDQLTQDDIVIYELSSFMLQDLTKSPDIAIVLNITPDHLDHHLNFKEYINAKHNIVCHQNSHNLAVLSADYLTSLTFAGITPANIYWFSIKQPVDDGAYFHQGSFYFSSQNPFLSLDEVQLKGKHNYENILAASLAAKLLGATKGQIRNAAINFRALEHRLEPILEKNNIKIINDSFSTNPESVKAAVNAYPKSILLVGGKNKNLSFAEIFSKINRAVKWLILFGEARHQLKKNLPAGFGQFSLAKDMASAVKIALKKAKKNDTILFSPGCASFDEFDNASQRGKKFTELILNLM